MDFRTVKENKKDYLELLLLADEQESMIDKYLERGELFVLHDGDLKTVCVVTDEGEGVLEVKNLATTPEAQGKGYGRAMLDYVSGWAKGRGHTLMVGTGDSPLALPFYEKCGFVISHRVPDFFLQYDHPIVEGGVQLRDMVYLKRAL